MEYTLERFELDMRKVDLYVENAVAAFNITADEASLYSESTEYDLIMTEASDGLGAKIKAAFTKILESLKKFFSGLIEKVKSIFTKNDEAKVKKIVASNPELGKQKIAVDDIKSIEKWCGKRKVLCAKLVKKAKAGTLTQDEFDKTVQQMDAMEAKIKSIGKIAIPVIAALAVLGTGGAIIARLKKEHGDGAGGVNEVSKDGSTLKVKVAQLWASVCTKTAQVFTSAKMGTLAAIKKVFGRKKKGGNPTLDGEDWNDYEWVTQDDDDDSTYSVGNVMREDKKKKIEKYKDAADEYAAAVAGGYSVNDYNSADDLDDFDLTDTFFDI